MAHGTYYLELCPTLWLTEFFVASGPYFLNALIVSIVPHVQFIEYIEYNVDPTR